MKTSHNSTWLNFGNLNHMSDALSRYKLVYKSDFTMKPTVLCPNAPMQYRSLGMSIEFPVLGIWQCFALMRFMFARTNHTLSSAPEVSSHVLLHFPAFSNPSFWAAACAQQHRAAPSSKTPMWFEEPTTTTAGLKWLQLQMLTITEENNRVGENVPSTNTAWITGERAGKSNVTIPPNHHRVILGSR